MNTSFAPFEESEHEWHYQDEIAAQSRSEIVAIIGSKARVGTTVGEWLPFSIQAAAGRDSLSIPMEQSLTKSYPTLSSLR